MGVPKLKAMFITPKGQEEIQTLIQHAYNVIFKFM
jgi:hypothetical protein